jgi:hypothetical protein
MKNRVALIVTLVSLLLLSACAPALSQQDIQGTVEIIMALTALAEQTQAPPVVTETATIAPATAEPTLEPPTETPQGPVVVFQDIFGDAEAQIRTRVVEPFVLYYRDLADYPALLTITISIVPDVAGYPYKAEAIFATGITAGFLIGVQGGLVDWWLPECMYSCGFSDAFRGAYPEIVGTMEP